MLLRLGKTPFEPEMMLTQIETELDEELLNLPIIDSSLRFIQQEVENIKTDNYVVCHNDINHNNWLLTDDNQLYLIDWDGQMIADPALDIGMLLYLYIDSKKWNEWFIQYGIHADEQLLLRMKWYFVAQSLLFVQWHRTKDRLMEMEQWINRLQAII